jgi:signal transduction histidine kinase
MLVLMAPPEPPAEPHVVPSNDHAWIAGAAVWLVVMVPSVLVLAAQPHLGPGDAAFLAAQLLFGAVFVLMAGPWEPASVRDAPHGWLLAAVASASAAVMLAPEPGYASILYILTAVLAGHALEPRQAYALVAFQTAVTFTATAIAYDPPWVALLQTVATGSFQVFAVATTLAMLSERAVRTRLAAANAELRATRALLRETAKLGERTRIARELHDLLGHHLTALSLHLEVAGHLAEPPLHEHVARAQAIAKLLMADVRGLVADMRAAGTVDLGGVLRALTTDLPRPTVHLDVDPAAQLDDPERAHAIVRCVQEAVTNAIRHGEARHVWITIATRGDVIEVVARDDGRGSDGVRAGHGLRGMRERLVELGGDIAFSTAPRAGFTVTAHLPVRSPLGST